MSASATVLARRVWGLLLACALPNLLLVAAFTIRAARRGGETTSGAPQSADAVPELILAACFLSSLAIFAWILFGRVLRPLDGLARRLQTAERLKTAVIDVALDAVIIADHAGRIIGFNASAERIFGCPAEDALGKPMGELIVPPERRAELAAEMQRLDPGPGPPVAGRRLDIEAQRHDGSRFPAEIAIHHMAVEGRGAFAAYARDLTQAHAAQASIAEQQHRMHHVEKLSAMGSLLAGVAHELNNPLAILIAQATLLREKAPTPDVQKRAEKILAAAQRAGRIVKSFTAMARQRPPERQQVDLNLLVGRTLELIGYSLRSAGVEVIKDLSDGLDPLDADADLIGQVVVHLVINAQQILRDYPRPRRIWITTRREATEVVLDVADNGPGVPEAIASRVFDPYFTTKPVGVGTGIGLSICKSIIESHDGTIVVGARPGGGALFRVSFEIGQGDKGAAEARPTDIVGGLRILVVDDEVEVAHSLADMMQLFDHQAVVMDVPNDALARVAVESFDLIFVDLRMPGMSGTEFRQRLLGLDPDLGSRTIIMTGDTMLGVTGAGDGRADPLFILEKPFTAADVTAIIARVTRGRTGSAA